jgi:SAM-dependent methyltransferase
MTGSISFEQIAPVYDATRGGLERGRDKAEEIAPWVEATPVLEIGVGTGAVAVALRELLERPVVGVDLSPAMLATAHDRLGNVVALGDVEQLPVPSGSIGTIVCVWVLQLVGSLDAVFSECIRALRPGGRVVVILGPGEWEPDDMVPLVSAAFADRRRPGGDPDLVRRAAEAAGLVVHATGLNAAATWEASPNDEADRFAQRSFGSVVTMDDATFAAVVEPLIAALRALPDPDQPRRRSSRDHFLVFEKSG